MQIGWRGQGGAEGTAEGQSILDATVPRELAQSWRSIRSRTGGTAQEEVAVMGEASNQKESVFRCQRCARPLGDDPDDDPVGDALGPLCGECVRVREFEVDLMHLDAQDGILDGDIEW